MKNVLTSYLYKLRDEGLMDEYSKEHLLIKAMDGKFDYIDKHKQLVNDFTYVGTEKELAMNFIANFSTKLNYLASKFPEEDIKEFVKNQLAAGKQNYSEEQFFQALSEIHVLNFLTTFGPGFKEGIYEPRLNSDDSNPEARIKYNNDIVIDVEVKTPGFIKTDIDSNNRKGSIKPNMVLTKKGIEKIKKYCERNNLSLVMPRVLKLKTFIESAAKKFEKPNSNKHFNILFINWTYTDFPECGLCEPITLLANPISGLLYNNLAQKILNINPEDLNKISAIVLYRDNINSILFGDFRYHWQDKSVIYLKNLRNNHESNFELLSHALHMNPYNNNKTIEWWPADFEYKEDFSQKEIEEACNFVGKVLFESQELVSDLYGDIDGNMLKDMILLDSKINKY